MPAQQKKLTLSIITPMSRPQNYRRLWESIKESVARFFDVTWIIVADTENIQDFFGGYEMPATKGVDLRVHVRGIPSKGNGLSGNPQRNLGIDLLNSESHVYFLDDDNIVHEDYGRKLSIMLRMKPTIAMVAAQCWPNGQIRLWANPGNMQPGGLDTAQITLPYDMVEGHRWDVWDYCADGVFFSKIFHEQPERFVFVPEVLCYYNYLEHQA